VIVRFLAAAVFVFLVAGLQQQNKKFQARPTECPNKSDFLMNDAVKVRESSHGRIPE
jgi:hypothetical protein